MHRLAAFTIGLLVAAASGHAQTAAKSFMPMRAGTENRPASWNSDGVPRPPAMWRGHGGDMWPNHYKACSQRYPSYDRRTDTYRQNRRRVRCAL